MVNLEPTDDHHQMGGGGPGRKSSSSVGRSHRRAESRWCQRDITDTVLEPWRSLERLRGWKGAAPRGPRLRFCSSTCSLDFQLPACPGKLWKPSSSSGKPLVFVSTDAKVVPNPKLEGADELPEIRLTRTIFRGGDSAEMRHELPARRPLQAAL